MVIGEDLTLDDRLALIADQQREKEAALAAAREAREAEERAAAEAARREAERRAAERREAERREAERAQGWVELRRR